MLKAFMNPNLIEAGCDEAGRGCLAGPVFAAAVILPKGFQNEELNDSKQLSEKKRYQLREVIEKEAICWGVGIVEAYEIDQINILNASFLAMHRAIIKLKCKPEFLLIDGNRFRQMQQIPLSKLHHQEQLDAYHEIPYACHVKGDGKFLSIAAASILAKTYRDDCMNLLHDQLQQYNWKSNKGYPTKVHRIAIREFGLTQHHRKSFKQLEDQLELFPIE